MVVMMAAGFVVKKKKNGCIGAHGVVVSHPLRMRKALGSNPSVSILIVIWKSGILLAVVAAKVYAASES